MSEGFTRGATIDDVAREAGTSTSTVSNVLNGRTDRMRSETLARVNHAIRTLNYRPNGGARQLKTGLSPMLGVIVPSVANPFYGAFVHAVQEAARLRGFSVLLANTERDAESERSFAEEMWSHGVRGLITGTSPFALDHLRDLQGRGLQIVACDRGAVETDEVALDTASMDNHCAARLATEHLIEFGHRRIAFVSGPLSTVNRRDRVEGFRAAVAAAGFDPAACRVHVMPTGETIGPTLARDAVRSLFGQASSPTAIVAMNDVFAFGICAGIRSLGLRVPDDVSVVGIDDILLAELVDPPLTTVRQPLREIAEAAVGCLLDRMREHQIQSSPRQFLFAPELILRGSTRRVA